MGTEAATTWSTHYCFGWLAGVDFGAGGRWGFVAVGVQPFSSYPGRSLLSSAIAFTSSQEEVTQVSTWVGPEVDGWALPVRRARNPPSNSIRPTLTWTDRDGYGAAYHRSLSRLP